MTTETTRDTADEWEVENGHVYDRAVTTRYTVEVNGERREGRNGLVALVYELHGEHATNGGRARLIAAAPEMARLLGVLACVGDNDGVLATVYRSDCAAARALLRRIYGG